MRKSLEKDDMRLQSTHNLPYSSIFEPFFRKRMSVVIKNIKTKKYYILTKGADEVIEKRSIACEGFSQEDLRTMLLAYAREGLRTMVLAYRELKAAEYERCKEEIGKTETMHMYQKKESLNTIYEEMERQLIIVGATGVEDQLQEGVAAVIGAMVEREICVWMLTGDKLETAVNISYSSKLLNSEDKLIQVKSIEGFTQNEELKSVLKSGLSVRNKKKRNREVEGRLCLAISGEVLWVIVSEVEYKKEFVKYLEYFDIVIAARVTPGQKAELVSLVKENVPRAKTLGIGDGANDVNMIITSDVGIAIYGKEGLQASRVADYSISEFKHLGPLLLHYGPDFYKRNQNYAMFNFYKNFLLIFPNI